MFLHCLENVEWVSSLAMGEPEPVYDFAWYPQMCSANPVTCCFLSTAKQQPIHLWDAYTGKVGKLQVSVTHGIDSMLLSPVRSLRRSCASFVLVFFS